MGFVVENAWVNQAKIHFMNISIKSVCPGVYEIRELGFVSSYLVTGTNLSVMIDTGFGVFNTFELIRPYVSGDVLVVNTHVHPDHSNGNRYFPVTSMGKKEWQNHGMKWNRSTPNILKGTWDPGAIFRLTGLNDRLPQGFNPEDYNKFVAKGLPDPNYLWADGDVIDLGSNSIQIFDTPAHTSGSISLLEKNNGIFFVGDAFAKNAPWYLHLKCRPGLEDTFNTFRLMAGLADKVKAIYPAHGDKGMEGAYLQWLGKKMQAIETGEIKGHELDHRTGKAVYFDIGGYGPYMPL